MGWERWGPQEGGERDGARREGGRRRPIGRERWAHRERGRGR